MGAEHVGAFIIRNNTQRLRFKGEVCLKCDKKIFPPRPKHECDENLVYNSSLLLPPDDKVIHCEVVRQNQEQYNEG